MEKAVNHLVSISQKKLAPETSITTVEYEAGMDPNFALVPSRNDEALTAVSNNFVTAFTKTWLGHLKKYAATPEGHAYKPLYNAQIVKIFSLEMLLDG